MFIVGTYLIPVVFHAYLFTENVTFEYKYISLPLNINNATVFSKGRGAGASRPKWRDGELCDCERALYGSAACVCCLLSLFSAYQRR